MTFRSKISERTLDHVAREYSADIQKIVGPRKTRVLVETTFPVTALHQEGQHLLEHGLRPIGHIHDAYAKHYLVECECTVGDSRIAAIEACGTCDTFIKAIHPNAERSLPEPMPLRDMSVALSKGKKVHVQVIPKDTLGKIQVPEVWAALGPDAGSKPINVGHLDTGAPAILDSRFYDDYYPNQPNPPDPAKVTRVKLRKSEVPGQSAQDMHGHGTKTLSLIAGQGISKDDGYKGPLFRASLYCFKVLSDQGTGLDSWILNGVLDARKYQLDVCTMSLGGPQVMQALEDAINVNVTQFGQAWCVATGNSGKMDGANPHPYACDRSLASPGSAREVFACGASDAGNEGGEPEAVQTWSSRPASADNRQAPDPPRGTLDVIQTATCQFYIMGPGVGISTRPGETPASGTSFATPNIAGVIGLLIMTVLFKQGKLSLRNTYGLVKMLRAAILQHADELDYWSGGKQNWTKKEAYCIEGWGRVNAKKAYDAITGGGPGPGPRKFNPAQSNVTTAILKPSPTSDREDGILTVAFDAKEYLPGDSINVLVDFMAQDQTAIESRSITVKLNVDNIGDRKIVATNPNGKAVATWTALETRQEKILTSQATFDGDP